MITQVETKQGLSGDLGCDRETLVGLVPFISSFRFPAYGFFFRGSLWALLSCRQFAFIVTSSIDATFVLEDEGGKPMSSFCGRPGTCVPFRVCEFFILVVAF